jgi:hypothetical protein
MRKLTCHCEQVFNVDLPETVNLDSDPGIIAQIADGSFLSCVCPTCGAYLHTDLRTRLEWPSKNVKLELIPEIDRLSFLSGTIAPVDVTDVVVGFAELADRVAVIRAGLDTIAIEALKYHLAAKAMESASDIKPVILFERTTESGNLEFHIHGIKKGEVAVSIVPLKIYDALRKEFGEEPDGELFASLRNGAYVSYQNILIEDTQ